MGNNDRMRHMADNVVSNTAGRELASRTFGPVGPSEDRRGLEACSWAKEKYLGYLGVGGRIHGKHETSRKYTEEA